MRSLRHPTMMHDWKGANKKTEKRVAFIIGLAVAAAVAVAVAVLVVPFREICNVIYKMKERPLYDGIQAGLTGTGAWCPESLTFQQRDFHSVHSGRDNSAHSARCLNQEIAKKIPMNLREGSHHYHRSKIISSWVFYVQKSLSRLNSIRAASSSTGSSPIVPYASCEMDMI